ncbi:MAG TPA: hypothetical protein VJN67_22970, partial [Stellaceae bacterium]|nr:hypothetical protein [Stellaceae bacterium]
MEGLLVLLGVLVAVEVLGLPILTVLYLSERARVAQRLNALTDELARMRSAVSGKDATAATHVAAPAPAPSPAAP